jgi:diguanylate cyclase (GGDEF)-like protein
MSRSSPALRAFAPAQPTVAVQPPAIPPETEAARLAALEQLDILDTPREEGFDRITRMIRRLFDMPISIVSFIDEKRQWYKSAEGMGVDYVPRADSFCRHTIATGTPLVVDDAKTDARFFDNPFVVTDPGIRSYIGIPLTTRDGLHIGSLCVADYKARENSARDIEFLTEFAAMAMDELELRDLATRDGLTGVHSRRAFKEEAARLVAFCRRHDQPLGCVSIDLDHFKSVNDTHGHAAGDRVLQSAVSTMASVLRQSDLIGRLGGEEFSVMLPGTARTGAMEAAERIRVAIAEKPVVIGRIAIPVTTSLGVAALRDGWGVDDLLRAADEALYDAKRSGRNRIAAAP